MRSHVPTLKTLPDPTDRLLGRIAWRFVTLAKGSEAPADAARDLEDDLTSNGLWSGSLSDEDRAEPARAARILIQENDALRDHLDRASLDVSGAGSVRDLGRVVAAAG